MKNLNSELKKNFDLFKIELKKSYSETFKKLETEENKFFSSYKRLASLEAWRAYLLEQNRDTGETKWILRERPS